MMHPLRGVSVYIKCNGSVLKEYGVKKEDACTRSCYVISENGKAFEVQIRNHKKTAKFVVCFDLYLDGIYTRGVVCGPGERGMIHSIPVSQTSYKPFYFATLETTDDERFIHSSRENWDSLGVIEVKVYRVVEGDTSDTEYEADVILDGPVHETSKKAGTHKIKLGDTIQDTSVKHMSTTTVEYIDEKSKPYAVFSFRYRPKEILQAQGIVPLSPANVIQSNNENEAGPSTRDKHVPEQGHGGCKRPLSEDSNDRPHQKLQHLASLELDVKPIVDDEHKLRIKEEENTTSDSEDDLQAFKEQLTTLQQRIAKMEARKRASKKQAKKSAISQGAAGSSSEPIIID